MNIDFQTWLLITGTLTPILIAALTHISASPRKKAVIGVLVAAIAAVVERATLADGSAVLTWGLLADVVKVYGVQAVSFLAFWNVPGIRINDRILPEHGVR